MNAHSMHSVSKNQTLENLVDNKTSFSLKLENARTNIGICANRYVFLYYIKVYLVLSYF